MFLDLKRAFETIDRSILLMKLKYYGVTGVVLRWLENYLSHRKQVTRINGSISAKISNNLGVPQGSVLGPLLFLIYFNDINNVPGNHKISLFADDTLVYVESDSLGEALREMNSCLLNINRYLKCNKLKLNISKTKGMIVTTKSRHHSVDPSTIDIMIDNEAIEIVTEIKYLGLILDNTLSLNNHAEYIIRKITKKLYFFSRSARFLSMYARLTCYNCLVKPHFDYCATLMFLFNQNKIVQLQKLQNRGMRIILKQNRFTAIADMHATLRWLTVWQRFYFLAMLFIFKITQGLQPAYLNDFLVRNNAIHNYPTRTVNNFYVPRTTFKSTMNSLFFKGLVSYNSLPNEVKHSTSVKLFKRNLLRTIV